MSIDFDAIWRELVGVFALGDWSLHGPNHWRNVEANGLKLAAATGADVVVVRLFAVFHDAARQNENHDPEHGERAAGLAQRLHGTRFVVSPEQLQELCYACSFHHRGLVTERVTAGTCWDADRLDLPRVGIQPHPDKMSTSEGKRLSRSPRS
ncbi:MAG TPA: HD domain-containing protein [Pirellulales bacterium]